MADRLGPVVAEAQLAIQLDPLRFGKRALFLFELQCHVEQSFLDALGCHRFGKERQMVPEHEDRARVVDLGVLADELLEEDRGHRGYVLVAETDVGQDEPLVAGLHGGDANPPFRGIHDPAARENFLAQRHRALGGAGRREHHLTLESRDVVVEQAAVLDDPPGDLPFAVRERRKRDRVAVSDLV